MKNYSYWLQGVLLAFLVWFGSIYAYDSYKSAIPVSDFFIAKVEIPDMKVGENPIIVYDRKIKKNFIGTFHAEIKSVENIITVCAGSVSGIKYDTTDKLDPSKVTLEWFLGKTCNLSPGQYFIETTWTINNENWPTKYYTNTSNIFEVE